MKWAVYLHHLTLHFPVVLTMVLAAVGVWSIYDETPQFRKLLRWGGWIAFGLTTVTVLSGLVTAPGWLGGGGSEGLSHHRSLGLMTWTVTGIAAWAYEKGVRLKSTDWRYFAAGAWCAASVSVIGTAHWGAAEEHPEAVPWLEVTEEEQAE